MSALKSFFAESVATAIRNQQLRTIEAAQGYLVDLLIEYVRVEGLLKAGPEADEPLALMLNRALGAAPAERIHVLRQMGDQALFLSGYFADRVDRTAVGIGYYISMGEGAYGALSGILRGATEHEASVSHLFEELAEKFGRFVGVLNEVSDRTFAASPVSLIRLYERWQRTRSRHYIERLLNEDAAPLLVDGPVRE
ncbi:MAG: hypothetical protein HYY84_06040 [Deltaproteobacteria bacterium]|nr:hypothetical protein [Deltaproteobacteria bacterium]